MRLTREEALARACRTLARGFCELADALAHPSVDDATIVELKRRKLHVKDEIARLKQHESTSVH